MATIGIRPEQNRTNDLDDCLSAMTRVVFQSGVGRTVVDVKADGIVEAFDGFDAGTVAGIYEFPSAVDLADGKGWPS